MTRYGGAVDYSGPEGKELLELISSTPLLSQEAEREKAEQLWFWRGRIQQLHTELRTTTLSVTKERDCHRALIYAEGELTALRDAFFFANIRLVIDIVNSMSRMEWHDMFQYGSLGLLRAIDLFDPSLPGGYVKFSTYASYWIKQSIQRGCDKDESLISLPVHIRDLLKALRRATIRYTQQYGVTPTLEEVCRYGGFDFAKVQKIKIIAALPLSLDSPYDPTSSNVSAPFLDMFPEHEDRTLDLLVAADEQNTLALLIQEAIGNLECAADGSDDHPFLLHAQAIRLRYRIGETDDRFLPIRNLEEVGHLMGGVSANKARQYQRAGFRWIRDHVLGLQETWQGETWDS